LTDLSVDVTVTPDEVIRCGRHGASDVMREHQIGGRVAVVPVPAERSRFSRVPQFVDTRT